MSGQLHISFIPTIRDECKFFVWIGDSKGRPNRENEYLYALLNKSEEWIEVIGDNLITPYETAFQLDDQLVAVRGLLFGYTELLTLFKHPKFIFGYNRYFEYADSIYYFKEVAAGINILLENGHFYPSLVDYEKDGSYYASAHWFCDHELLETSGLLKKWLSHIPPISLAPKELENITTKQWLYLLMNMWLDALIRQTSNPIFDQVVNDWLDEGLIAHDHAADWFNFLTIDTPAFFLATGNYEKTAQVKQLKKDILNWTAGAGISDIEEPLHAISAFYQEHWRSFIQIQSVNVYIEPDQHEEPFEPDTIWTIQLSVEGIQNNEKSLFNWEEAAYNHPVNKQRLDQIEFLLNKHIPELNFQQLLIDGAYDLNLNTVLDLYRKQDELLEQNIRLLFPSWLKIKKAKEQVDLDLDIGVSSSFFDLSSLTHYDWRIAVGDMDLSADEFKRLVDQQKSFVQRNGQWIELPLDKMIEAYEAMREAESLTGQNPSVGDALQLKTLYKGKRKKPFHLNIDHKLDDYLKGLLKKPSHSIGVPEHFHGQLRPYQKKGYTWLTNLAEKRTGCCLADDMGLGKTIQTIAYITRRLAKHDRNKILIICPTSLLANWRHEFKQFAPRFRLYTHHGPERMSAGSLEQQLDQFDCILTSYSLLLKDIDFFSNIEWSSVIIDEAQTIKNPHAKKSRAVRALKAEHRIALTGTPIENRLEELWSIMEFLNPGYLGPLNKFREHFVRPIVKENSTAKTRMLQKMISPFILRREKTDKRIIKDLPKKMEIKEYCHLSKVQASLYQSVVNELMQHVRSTEGMKRKGLILSTLTKLKQICDHPNLLTDKEDIQSSGKLKRLFELVHPLVEQNEKLLIFTQYVKMGKLLEKTLEAQFPNCRIYFLHGGLTAEGREKLISHFRETETSSIFILSLKAGGVGLNLTEARHVVHFDRWWNPAVEEQATDRVYRIGQTENVNVHKMICEGTIEERIDELIEQKKSLSKQILSQGEGWVTELSDKEIFDLIRLRKEVLSS
ncbi:SNF2 family DNA or RNA helicase [Scopulibacillus daqui]|uniref:SNF2 family DNA or RNA helicase n=1 Tax=Scopulibacillus daqui TaxID=1469162 RepID=A0ABS2Q3R1_9BACL|nr:DEAD/DEAH box helicase [Scopulibacillus daqui]MBM7646937.1 SNF2 family DNA or RNA helicase [Scopulibacillus daqui]